MHLIRTATFSIAALVLLTTQSASALELSSRQVVLGNDLSMLQARKVANKLFKMDNVSTEPIYLIINTRSGYAPAAMVIVDAIGAIKAKVHAVIQTEAFGVGGVVSAFCHRRSMFPNASLYFTKLEYASKTVMKKKPPIPAPLANAYISRVYALVAKRIGMKSADFAGKIEKGWYLTAADAKRSELIDEVVKRVTWIHLVVETVEVKTSTSKKVKKSGIDLK
jgi:ATP-dependent protease ClpP protease subunit